MYVQCTYVGSPNIFNPEEIVLNQENVKSRYICLRDGNEKVVTHMCMFKFDSYMYNVHVILCRGAAFF